MVKSIGKIVIAIVKNCNVKENLVMLEPRSALNVLALDH